ncbi:MAG: hypothetical protein HYY01_09710 [Chloroflexi bacterium]|nr:hypothetical protein [Chloroflexota bacterium]
MTKQQQKGINIGLTMAAAVYGLGAILLLSGVAGRVAWAFLASFAAVVAVTLAWAIVHSVLPRVTALANGYQDPWVQQWEALMQRPCR